ncbi:hypothetical protein KI123_002836 [Enterococcus faecalis]|nr:hypothetical protein [Enterococcus faecalis]
MNPIKLCYVDDKQDLVLSDYLLKFCETHTEFSYKYTEHRFTEKENYETLLSNKDINAADIIVIDSWLFSSNQFQKEKLTGEQFKIVLKKIFPYKKTVVISQNEIAKDSMTISKYRTSNKQQTSYEYYDRILKPLIEKYTKEFLEEQNLINIMSTNHIVDSVLVSKIEKNLEGLNDETPIKKTDIDALINLFQEVKDRYNDK